MRIGRRAAEGIVEVAAEEEADLIIFGWGGQSGPDRDAHGPVISPTIDEVVRDAPCDIAVVKQRGVRDVRRILVPVRGGPHAELALRFADALAAALRRDGRRDARRAGGRHRGRPRPGRARAGRVRPPARDRALASRSCARPPNVRTAILREAERADLVVMGASAPPGEPGTSLFGALPEAIAQQARAHRHRRQDPRAHRPPDLRAAGAAGRDLEAADRAAEESRAVPARVERWFAESSFHHSEFADLARLRRSRRSRG